MSSHQGKDQCRRNCTYRYQPCLAIPSSTPCCACEMDEHASIPRNSGRSTARRHNHQAPKRRRLRLSLPPTLYQTNAGHVPCGTESRSQMIFTPHFRSSSDDHLDSRGRAGHLPSAPLPVPDVSKFAASAAAHPHPHPRPPPSCQSQRTAAETAAQQKDDTLLTLPRCDTHPSRPLDHFPLAHATHHDPH